MQFVSAPTPGERTRRGWSRVETHMDDEDLAARMGDWAKGEFTNAGANGALST